MGLFNGFLNNTLYPPPPKEDHKSIASCIFMTMASSCLPCHPQSFEGPLMSFSHLLGPSASWGAIVNSTLSQGFIFNTSLSFDLHNTIT